MRQLNPTNFIWGTAAGSINDGLVYKLKSDGIPIRIKSKSDGVLMVDTNGSAPGGDTVICAYKGGQVSSVTFQEAAYSGTIPKESDATDASAGQSPNVWCPPNGASAPAGGSRIIAGKLTTEVESLGLVALYDTTKSASYSGTGNIWADISGSGYNAVFNPAAPLWVNGQLLYNGTVGADTPLIPNRDRGTVHVCFKLNLLKALSAKSVGDGWWSVPA